MKMQTKPGMPFADSRIAGYLTKQIDALLGRKSQRQIAQEIGYDKPNMISMFKRGEARVPLDKIPLLAKSLNVDPAFLFRLGMEQYWQDLRVVNEVFGTVVSRSEAEIITAIREIVGDADPKFTPAMCKQLTACFSAMK
jgi:transcriptional regulator with XRE-family HTH domain